LRSKRVTSNRHNPGGAVLNHYRRPDGKQSIDAALHDLARWPPIAARIKELKREC